MLLNRDVRKRVSAFLAIVLVLVLVLVREHRRVGVSVGVSDPGTGSAPDRRSPTRTPTRTPTPRKSTTPIKVSGHVLDELDRTAVKGAEVTLRNELGEASAQTTDDGSFSLILAPGDYRVAVHGGGVITAGPSDRVRLDGGPLAALAGAPDEALMPLVHATSDIANLELAATPASTITGRVIDQDSHNVAHAIVRARGVLRSATGSDVVESDDRGEFTLEVPAGRYALQARAPGFAGLATGIEIVARPHGSQRVALLVARGCEIRGRVVRADGTPTIDGAIERRLGDGPDAFGPVGRIDPDGTFDWTSFETGEVTLRAWPWKSMPSAERTFACRDGAQFADVVLHVPDHQPALAGTVVDSSGAPVPFAYLDVEALDAGKNSQQERADAEGRWEVHELTGGRYQITASAAERGIAVTTVAVPRGEEVKLQLTGTGRIEGTTTSLANGTMLVSFQACFDAHDLQHRPMEIAHEPRLVTVSGGRFVVEDAPACDLELSARWRGQLIQAHVVVPPADIGHVELPLGPPHEKVVHGTVRDANAQLAANVHVSANANGQVAVAVTDDEGNYTLRTAAGAALAASNGKNAGHGTVGRANVPDERVDITLAE